MYEFVDAHIHLYKFTRNELDQLYKGKKYIFLTVAEDISSSLQNVKLSMLYENVIPSVGIHPWKAHKTKKEDLEKIKEIVDRTNIKVLGEVGLDKHFVPQTFERQKEIFIEFLKLAKEYDLSLNLHTPNAWKEVLDLLIKFDIRKAYFHWYIGPLELLEEIKSKGYFVGINVAAFKQEKMLKTIESADLNIILTESDAPYEYKGLILHPLKIPELINLIAEYKNVQPDKVIKVVKQNLSKFLS